MALQQEIWKNELLKRFRATATHFDGVPDYSSDVLNGKVIHLADIGADPDILINNTTYPITSTERTDADVAITLDLFETTNTKIPYQSLFNLAYDKKASIIEQHKEVLMEAILKKGTHAMGPAGDTANTPVVSTTGTADGAGRKALTIADLNSLKLKFDELKIPQMNRRLILCPQHVKDLLNISQAFEKMYNVDRNSGKIGPLAGFEIHEFVSTPYYTNAGAKKAYGASLTGTDGYSSIAFYVPRGFKAIGEVMAFLQESKDDPANRQTTIGYAMRAMISPKKSTGEGAAIGAIITGF